MALQASSFKSQDGPRLKYIFWGIWMPQLLYAFEASQSARANCRSSFRTYSETAAYRYVWVTPPSGCSRLEDFQSDSRTSRIPPAFAPPDRSSTTTFAMHRLGDLCSTHRNKRPLYCQNSMDFTQSAKLKLRSTDAFSRYMISSSTYIARFDFLSNFFR
jgi:hypothetical protein